MVRDKLYLALVFHHADMKILVLNACRGKGIFWLGRKNANLASLIQEYEADPQISSASATERHLEVVSYCRVMTTYFSSLDGRMLAELSFCSIIGQVNVVFEPVVQNLLTIDT